MKFSIIVRFPLMNCVGKRPLGKRRSVKYSAKSSGMIGRWAVNCLSSSLWSALPSERWRRRRKATRGLNNLVRLSVLSWPLFPFVNAVSTN